MSVHKTRLQIFSLFSCFLASFFSHSVSAINDGRTCYDPKNNPAPEARPCVSADIKPVSHCCAYGATCLGDTLCLSEWGTLYVGACTVKDWATGNAGLGDCPKYCRKYNADNVVDPSIGLCSNGTYPFSYCCNVLQGTDECCRGELFQIDNSTSQYLNQVSPSDASSTSSPSPSSSTSALPLPSGKSDDNKARIGLGVGLGVPLAMALCLLFWEFRKRRKAEAMVKQYQREAGPRIETTQSIASDNQQIYYSPRYGELDDSQGYGELGAPQGRIANSGRSPAELSNRH